jgi:hypothetical protein
MPMSSRVPTVSDVIEGRAVFRDDMPVWSGRFGDDIWPFVAPDSPLYKGPTTSSFVWRDYIDGRGTTLSHPNSVHKAKYTYCLTKQIVRDLKIAAVIFGNFPNLIKDAKTAKEQLDPKTVKGRIDDLAKFFSSVILKAKEKPELAVASLAEIPFSLVKETVASFAGRPEHLKRALKLISDPSVQKNLSEPLQWGLSDITGSSISWRSSEDEGGIPTLSDAQFLYLLDYCKKAIVEFKSAAGLGMHDSDCQALGRSLGSDSSQSRKSAFDSYYGGRRDAVGVNAFRNKHGLAASELHQVIKEGHTSAMLLVLLFTGMRATEVAYLKRNCLKLEHGYWFLVSKEVKQRSKDTPISEGWLAIDIVRDAYDILMFITAKTGNEFLFSSPWLGQSDGKKGYTHGGTLNTLFARWLQTIDSHGLFVDWTFSIHQCRETLVSQLAQQEVGLPFISMQLKHFRSQFSALPNSVTAGYGQYRKQLMTSISNRLADARERALLDVYGEEARFAGGGAVKHKARIDGFFSGMGLFGERREKYIKDMARRGVKLMPTSIGNCGKNLAAPTDSIPPCYGDFQCDPDCPSHLITDRAARALVARKNHAMGEAERETNPAYKKVWWGLVQTLDRHVAKLERETTNV